MNLLILRCGETRLAYRLMLEAKGMAAVSGEVRRIGGEAEHVYSYPRGRGEGGADAATFTAATARLAALLGDVEVAPGEVEQVETVAHLFPVGGTTPVPVTRVDDGLVAQVSKAGGAPGNRGAIESLVASRDLFARSQHVVVWDDAFFCDLPPESRGYLLPESLDLPFDLRRRGYRGLLHAAALNRVTRLMGSAEPPRRSAPRISRPPADGQRIVLCFFDRHAGVTAVLGNAPVWTTFGTGPGDGLPGERGVGSIPLSALETVLQHTRLPSERLLAVLRNDGGLGAREPEDVERVALEAFRGAEPSRTVFATFVREVVGAIGAAATILGGMDALVFIGERALASHRFRTAVCAGLAAWGVDLPHEGPVATFEVTPLHDPARTPVYAASVNEDELVAREVGRFVGDADVGPSIPPAG
ncbi:MAG: hypothetical protein HY905_10105 [Deltaproteobacteria bacterium]|nr:hypothetical protein [Deltaproteobacteria bacterium]